jgi:hypothetical protein
VRFSQITLDGDKTTTFTTPLMRAPGESDTGLYLSDDEMALIERLEAAASDFVDGAREQADMFQGTPEDATQPELPAPADLPKRRKKKQKPEVATGGVPEWNPPGEPLTDAKLRDLLARVDRDVPIDAIAAWTAGERDQAARWAVAETHRLITQNPNDIAEPECVQKSATLPLKAEEWTPVRVSPDGAQEIKAAVEAGAE